MNKELDPHARRIDLARDADQRQQACERMPLVGWDERHHGNHQHGGEMHHCGTDEGLQRGAILLGEDARADRGRDEHQADQGRRRRTDQHVEVVPIID